MAQDNLLAIESTSSITQTILYKGEQYSLQPYSVQSFTADVSNAFLLQRPRHVREFVDVVLPPIEPGQSVMWLANTTGNPFLPETVQVSRVVRGERVQVDIPNSLREPWLLHYVMRIGQEWVPSRWNPGEQECLNRPPFRFTLSCTMLSTISPCDNKILVHWFSFWS